MSADLPFPSRQSPTRPGAGLSGPLGSLAGDPGSPEPALRTVRLAWATDAPAVAAAQAADLRRVLGLRADAGSLPEPADLEPAWRHAITRPPTARHRVLVAVELDSVVGFAATAPAADPDSDVATDGEVVALHAVPRELPAAPGTAAEAAVAQLLAALTAGAADALAADGFSRAQIWVATTDDVLRVVLSEAGWVPDGASRSSATETGDGAPDAPPLHQVRLHVGLGESGLGESGSGESGLGES